MLHRKAEHLSRKGFKRDTQGFTLIEVLIIVMVLGILAAIVVTAALKLTGASSVTACKAEFKTVETAQEAYRVQVGRSATSFDELTGTTVGVSGAMVGPWIKEAPLNTRGYILGFDVNPGPTYGDITVASTNPVHGPDDGNADCAYA